MKSALCAVFTGALLCSISLAQEATPSSSASPQQQDTTRQAPSEEQAAQPPTSGSQTSATPATSTAQPQSPSRQAPSEEQAAQPSGRDQQANSGHAGTDSENGVKRLAPGSVIPVQLSKSIDAKKVKTGDEVVAKVTQDMRSNNGEVIVAKDSKVLGRVTEAQARSKEQKESQVGIWFDRAVMKNGSEMQMPMSIQAIIGPQNNNSNAAAANQTADEGLPASTGGTAGKAPGMAGATAQQSPTPSSIDEPSASSNSGKNARGPINAQTQGVVGLPNLKLQSSGQAATQGSVVSSETNNVKLDSGTMLLLRVNQ